MSDEIKLETETPLNPSIEKKTEIIEKDTPASNGEEPMIPKSRLDQVSGQVRAEREKNVLLEEKIKLLSAPKVEQDPDLEKVAEALAPMFVQKGFITKEQRDEEDGAKRYSEQLKNLTTKYDGEDGRPVFDPYEISEFAKQTQVFDLETAYEKKYKKELFDWDVKNMNNGDDIRTEKPGEKVYNNGGNHNILTREEIAKKIAAPGGDEWYEKNRDALLKALEKGEIR